MPIYFEMDTQYANFGGNPLYHFNAKICILCVCVKINKHSFEPFCVWILPKKEIKKCFQDTIKEDDTREANLPPCKSFPFNYKTESTLENSLDFFQGLGIIIPYTVGPE